ncbi:hypothetical protein TIFTF001_002246 [Ficus carica]|uniref:Thaumatin-like protein n=1 Tax=Ficus carica TaxID=3494 RepID=A0AA88CRV1_FICCA|nr:hypothetical protein TIFTF001_002246 [Ficus carica]
MDALATRLAKVVVVFFLCLHHIAGTSSSLMITIRSSCADTIWPAIVSKPHSPELISENMTGFALRTGEFKTVSAPDNWTGTVWSRTHCKINAAGKFTCGTGDCGSSAVECPGGSGASVPGGSGASVPAATTLVDFTLNGVVGEYTYSVSLAKGFNLPVTVVPGGVESRSNTCKATGCDADLNKECPKEVQVVLIGNNNSVIGCNSACEAFKESRDHYCGRANFYDVRFCASSFSSTPPISELLRASSSNGHEGIPGEEVLTDDSSTSGSPVVKIIIGILSPLGAGLLSYLGYFLWRHKSGSTNCPLVLCRQCCINVYICSNCFNSSHRRGSSASKPSLQQKHQEKGKKPEEGAKEKGKKPEEGKKEKGKKPEEGKKPGEGAKEKGKKPEEGAKEKGKQLNEFLPRKSIANMIMESTWRVGSQLDRGVDLLESTRHFDSPPPHARKSQSAARDLVSSDFCYVGFAPLSMWNFDCYSGMMFLPFLTSLPVGLPTGNGRFCPC